MPESLVGVQVILAVGVVVSDSIVIARLRRAVERLEEARGPSRGGIRPEG